MALWMRWLSGLPLLWVQRIGWTLGWLTWWLSPRYRLQFKQHSQQAGYNEPQVRAAIGAAGCQALEAFRVWFGGDMPVQWQGKEHIETAFAAGKGILFLTPHLGCFEITAPTQALTFGPGHGPMTILYRPARQVWLKALLLNARDKPYLKAVPTNMEGVRQMLKALRRGEAVGLLPDQVPPEGMGIWSSMWGHPAYTMTLGARLAMQTGACIILAWGERLPNAKGYCIHVEPMQEVLAGDVDAVVLQINHAMEQLIRQCPEQYLWGYARFKQPRHEA